MIRIALVGDYSAAITAHQAIPLALEKVRAEVSTALSWQWIHTHEIRNASRDLADFAAVWAVPGSPYANAAGALEAIRWARETARPFLGTCGGFQHALIEIARDIAGLADADHAETNPTGATLVVAPLACSLVEHKGMVHFSEGSRLREIYGCASAQEGYRCRYGLDPRYCRQLEAAGLRFTAFDEAGDIRAAELASDAHPFFFGTLYQPERAALGGTTPPLVRALARAALAS